LTCRKQLQVLASVKQGRYKIFWKPFKNYVANYVQLSQLFFPIHGVLSLIQFWKTWGS